MMFFTPKNDSEEVMIIMGSFALALALIIFFIFVAPIWLWLHYRNKRQDQSLEANDLAKLNELALRANKLQERVNILERIIDNESPNWRKNND